MPTPDLSKLPRSPLRWVPGAARFQRPDTGQFLSAAAVRARVDANAEHFQERMQAAAMALKPAAAQFQAGTIDGDQWAAAVGTWQAAHKSEIKSLHLAHYAAGVGGFRQMSQSDYGTCGQRIRTQYRFINDFAAELIERPEIATNAAPGKMNFEQRVGLYADQGVAVFEQAKRQAHRDAGFTFEANVLATEAIHCAGPNGCPAQSARGRVSLGALVPIGERECGGRCRCRLEFFRSAA